MKKKHEEELDIFDAVNDEMKDLFECDLDCSTCDGIDRGKCIQNFRLGNIFLQKKCRQLVHMFDTYLETFAHVLEGASALIVGLKEATEEPKENEGDTHYFS